jgi:hypothetical protein
VNKGKVGGIVIVAPESKPGAVHPTKSERRTPRIRFRFEQQVIPAGVVSNQRHGLQKQTACGAATNI